MAVKIIVLVVGILGALIWSRTLGPSGPTPTDGWQAAWDDYQRRRRWARVVTFAGLLLVAIADGLLKEAHVPDGFFGFVAVSWLVASAVTMWRQAHFQCPRCGKYFASGMNRQANQYDAGWQSAWRRLTGNCVHCGIGVDEDPSSAA